MSPGMIAHLRAMSRNMVTLPGAHAQTMADAQDLALICDAMEAGRPVEVARTGIPPVPWLPDRPLYVGIVEFDHMLAIDEPRFICDRFGIPQPNRDAAHPFVLASLVHSATREEARKRAMSGKRGRGAIARLVIVEAEL